MIIWSLLFLHTPWQLKVTLIKAAWPLWAHPIQYYLQTIWAQDWFMILNLTPLQTCQHTNISHQQTKSLSSVVWKTSQTLGTTLLDYNSTERVCWLSRNLNKSTYAFVVVLSTVYKVNARLWCHSSKYFNFKSVGYGSIICFHTLESPHWQQATIGTLWFNKLYPERLSWKPHFVQFWYAMQLWWSTYN